MNESEIKKVFNELKGYEDFEMLGQVRKVLAILMLSDKDLSKINFDYKAQQAICKKLEKAFIPEFQQFKEDNTNTLEQIKSRLEELKALVSDDKSKPDTNEDPMNEGKTVINDKTERICDQSQQAVCEKLTTVLIPEVQEFQKDRSNTVEKISPELEALEALVALVSDDKSKPDTNGNPMNEGKIDLLQTVINDETEQISDHSLGLLPETCIQKCLCQLQDILHLFTDSDIETAERMITINTIKNKLSTTNAQYITIPTEILNHYQHVINKENAILNIFKDIYDKFMCIKYGLSTKINEEVLFGLAFVNPKCFPDNSIFKRLVIKRKCLYKQIYDHTDCFKPNGKMNSSDLNKFIYWNLKTILKFYTKNPPQVTADTITKGEIPLTTCIMHHIDIMNAILSESFVIDKNIPLEYRNLDVLQKQLNITDVDLANVLGISKSAFSKNKNQHKLFEKLKLVYFYNVSRDFIYGQTTLTDYGKLGFYGQKLSASNGNYSLSNVERRMTGRFLIDIFKNHISYDEINIRWKENQKIPENQKMLLQYLTILEDNVNNLTEKDYAAMIQLLRLKVK